MTAKVKDTGEIIEVKKWQGASEVVYSTPDMNMFYAEDELEFLPDTPEEVTIVGMWREVLIRIIYVSMSASLSVLVIFGGLVIAYSLTRLYSPQSHGSQNPLK